jgi:hypothetical protein
MANIVIWTIIPKREAVTGNRKNSRKESFHFVFVHRILTELTKSMRELDMECSKHGKGWKCTQNVVSYEQNIYISFRQTLVFKGNMYSVITLNDLTPPLVAVR